MSDASGAHVSEAHGAAPRVVLITGTGSGIGAALIAFLLFDEARHITGQVIHVDGGLTLG
jgi:NAD(P)-dependent dehydrogenase (short-subunit alcohol dehydrogenase family)